MPKQAVAVELDISQNTQVLWNLVRNSSEAMDGTGRLDLDLEELDRDLVRIRVHDRGKGIAPADIDRVFEPFFIPECHGFPFSNAWKYDEVERTALHGVFTSIEPIVVAAVQPLVITSAATIDVVLAALGAAGDGRLRERIWKRLFDSLTGGGVAAKTVEWMAILQFVPDAAGRPDLVVQAPIACRQVLYAAWASGRIVCGRLRLDRARLGAMGNYP